MSQVRSRGAGIVVGAVVAGLVVGGGLAARAQGGIGHLDADRPTRTLDNMIAPTAAPRVGDDVSIGPWESGTIPPDLTPITLEDGREGCLRVYDMANASPDKQKARRVSETTVEILLPVHAKDGQTRIGEFVAGTITEE